MDCFWILFMLGNDSVILVIIMLLRIMYIILQNNVYYSLSVKVFWLNQCMVILHLHILVWLFHHEFMQSLVFIQCCNVRITSCLKMSDSAEFVWHDSGDCWHIIAWFTLFIAMMVHFFVMFQHIPLAQLLLLFPNAESLQKHLHTFCSGIFDFHSCIQMRAY